MSNELTGKRIAVLATDGVEQVELTTPRRRLADAGADVVFVAPGSDDVQAVESDIDPADTFTPDSAVDGRRAGQLRRPRAARRHGEPGQAADRRGRDAFVTAFVDAGKPIAAICHGPWTLVEADAVHGRTLTSWPRCRPTSATPAAPGSTSRP